MTDINHRRKNKPKVDRRYDCADYSNGYARFVVGDKVTKLSGKRPLTVTYISGSYVTAKYDHWAIADYFLKIG